MTLLANVNTQGPTALALTRNAILELPQSRTFVCHTFSAAPIGNRTGSFLNAARCR